MKNLKYSIKNMNVFALVCCAVRCVEELVSELESE